MKKEARCGSQLQSVLLGSESDKLVTLVWTLCTVLKIIMQLCYKALNCVKQKTCTKTNAHWFDRKMFWEASHVDT